MKLKIYNTENTLPAQKVKPSFVSITGKGIFTISAQVEETLKLKDGSTVNLVQDEENPTDWFLMVAKPEDKGFTLRRESPGISSPLIFNSAPLASAIFTSCKVATRKGSAVRLPIAAQPLENIELELYAILTAALKKEGK